MGPNLSSHHPNDRQFIEQLETFLGKLVYDDEFSGVILFAKDGQPLFKKAYGLANKSFEVPNQVDTKFNIASMGKMFTGVAVAQLAEQGKLSFEDPVSKYLSSAWLKQEITEKIQIQHLLTHTSGLGNYFNEKFWQSSKLLFRTVEDFKLLVGDEILSFEPGTQWSYSNTGFLLLGAIIEKVTGSSYFDYVREYIYEPAGMINTDAFDVDRLVPNLAIGYIKECTDDEGVKWRNNLFDHVIKGGPAGGSFSTIEDLLNFDIALRSHKLLSPEYKELVLSEKPEIGAPGYGYGFVVSQEDAGHIAGHEGGFSGISCQLKMYLDLGYTIVVLSNYGPPSASIIVDNISGGWRSFSETILKTYPSVPSMAPPSHGAAHGR